MIGTGSVICFLYHPYLVSFSFYAIPICPLSKFTGFFIHLSPLIFMSFLRNKYTCLRLLRLFVGGCHGDNVVHMYYKFHLHGSYTEQVMKVKK